ncbi:hypothetical protein BN2475_550015 [Paraburkholderia ribeironis]|uniref:Uncharacterized protein n=1 Tax=Paraburkholderia ribeironis TaxID=1247936 RepID=A0A1N7SDC0_9BURK|nr:hypothetical protein [Paraburkholderia ribeironis]SIT45370.1 hypothetical protein BN2475_550015 [Paraburkholderia ribeironis]
MTQNSTDIAGLQSTVGSFNGAVAYAVQYDSSAHDKVMLGGTAASAPIVQLTNLKDDEISATSSDAVTGAQLWSTNQQIGNLSRVVQNFQGGGDAYVCVNSAANAAQAAGQAAVTSRLMPAAGTPSPARAGCGATFI